MNASAAKIKEWREQPTTFVREVLGATPDLWQEEALQAVVKSMRLALKACKGPGKSTFLAWVGWWFLLTRPHPKVVAVSISGDNLRDNLWSEFSKWQKRSPLLSSAFTWTAERISANDHPETWWCSARQWSKSADATQQADTLAGLHADHVLFLVDEAGGIPDAVVAAAEAGLANAIDEKGTEAKLLIAGNPTHLSGPLYRACTRERALWWIKEISSAPEDPKRTTRVSAEWARQQIEKYGANSPWVRINVYGEFPPGQSDALLGIEEVTAAAERVIRDIDIDDEVKILGVDVARFGDDRTVLFQRQARGTVPPRVFRNLDTMQVAGEVAQVIERWEPAATFIDQTGIGGGVIDRLRQLNYQVIGVDNGGKPLAPGKYADRRAEMWSLMAEWLREGGGIPNDPELISELHAPTYWFDRHNHLRLESKDELKARGLPSPDLADALALTFAAPVAHPGLRRRGGGLGAALLAGTNLGRRGGYR